MQTRSLFFFLLALGLAVVSLGMAPATARQGNGDPAPAGRTFADYALDATAALQSRWLAAPGWHMCLVPGCPTALHDWGADALTYDLYFRWRTDRDPGLPAFLNRLIPAVPAYAPCTGPRCSQWSDVPMWDSVAASREFAATGETAALRRAIAAFAAVQGAPAVYARGGCPDIHYQQPFGGSNHLKTLETDSNYVKAAMLLYDVTGRQDYLADASAEYAAIRNRFLIHWSHSTRSTSSTTAGIARSFRTASSPR